MYIADWVDFENREEAVWQLMPVSFFLPVRKIYGCRVFYGRETLVPYRWKRT